MPTTVNGVGTHYYGKRNLTTRQAACASCHRVGVLESYDTRLWFVVFFIPIIPLGRKRIMDACPSCSRHFAASADAYEQAKQLQTSGALEQYQREPSPETALIAHANMLGFREHEQAAEFRAAALARFPAHAGMRVGMAQQLYDMASHQEANQLFQEAHALDPSDPGARAGVAVPKMAAGELDEARKLLDYMEEPGAGQHYALGPLDILAGYYQSAGRHEEALRLAAILLREWPAAGNLYAFRSFVQKSEKALGRSESILPPRQFSLAGLFRSENSPYAPWQRGLVIGGGIVALVIAGLALNNEYIRRHRIIHVVNACGAAAQVHVDDQPPVTVADQGQLSVAEGPHTIKISGPVEETHEVVVDSGYFDRWFNRPAWVLNPGGEAVLQEIQHFYAQAPRPSQHNLIVGQPFFARPHYDYVMEKAPDRISVSRGGEVAKTELTWVQGNDLEAFHAVADTDRGAALDFAQRRLRRHPEAPGLLKAYLSRARLEDRPRMKEFLGSRLDARPVQVMWHRAYQSVAEQHLPDKELIARYDSFLAAEPNSGALLYLRGRLEDDADREEDFYRRAIKADPKLAWPWIALASRASESARWQECLTAARQAKELPVDEPTLLDELLHIARLATGEADKLIEEYRARLASHPMEPTTLLFLTDALVVAGKADEIDPAIETWENSLPGELRGLLSSHVRAFALYQAGKAEECEKMCSETAPLQGAPTRAHALLALGQAMKAAEDASLAKVWEDPWNALALSVGLDLEGKAEDAAGWRAKALEKFKAGPPDMQRVAKVLGSAEPPSPGALARLYPRHADKALLLVALATRFPAQQQQHRDLAAKLNVRRTPHYLLLRRALETKAGS